MRLNLLHGTLTVAPDEVLDWLALARSLVELVDAPLQTSCLPRAASSCSFILVER
jgi:hypothetical protein